MQRKGGGRGSRSVSGGRGGGPGSRNVQNLENMLHGSSGGKIGSGGSRAGSRGSGGAILTGQDAYNAIMSMARPTEALHDAMNLQQPSFEVQPIDHPLF